MVKRFFMLIMVFLITVSAGFSEKVGKTGWSIFRKARSAKFKPITVTPVMAVRGDLSGVFYNPAVLALNMHKEIFFLSELGMTEDMFGGIVYGHPMKDKKSTVAGGIIYYDAGKMELNWLESGQLKSDEVTAQRDILGILSYGRLIKDNIALGATVKVATSRLVERESAMAFAGDFGFLYIPKVPKIEKISITGAVQNLGSSSKFVEKANPLPFSAFIGAGYFLEFSNYYLSPGCDLTYLFDEARMVPEIGFEIGRDPYSINLGYKFNVEEGVWHIGFTLLKEKYDFAYAYLPGIYLESTHRFSVGYRFR